MSTGAARAPLAAGGRPGARYDLPGGKNPANVLIPLAYELAWTELAQVFNLTLSPGELAAVTGSTSPESIAEEATATAAANAPQFQVTNFPPAHNSTADRPYQNPISVSQQAIGANTNGQLLPANAVRTLLIVQNNSPTGDATFIVSFGQPGVFSGFGNINLTPGQSLTLDASCPRDSVNILVVGGTGFTSGVLLEGSFQAQPPTPPSGNVSSEAWGFMQGGGTNPAIAAQEKSIPSALVGMTDWG